MSTRRFTAARLLVGCGLLLNFAAPLDAQDELVAFRFLSPESALEIAQATLERCRDDGYQVAVAVVDRSGILQILIRDRLAGPHSLDAAERKAWTAASFREDTLTLATVASPGSSYFGVRAIDRVLMLGGGIPISVSGSVVAGVGVAGAESPEADHACAESGIAAVIDRLELSAGE